MTRPYQRTDMSGRVVDLDDRATYAHLPSDDSELTNRMWKNIGFALSYMDFIHREVFPMDNNQRARVYKLIARYWSEGNVKRKDGTLNRFDPRWLKEQIFIFEDETENMC